MTITLEALREAVRPWNKVLVAFSGGLDSTVLLHQLVTLREQERPELQLRAAHVHHGISSLADGWVTHCEQLCNSWRVPLTVCRVRLAGQGLGIEAEARAARYDALANVLDDDEVLVTAQHLDDQCETLLLALKRGSGPAGLAAMPATMPFCNSHIVRPLLGFSREELAEWADAHALRWIDDDSNSDDSYDRNFLRLRVLPVLSERWPHFARMAARSASLCGEQEQLLDELLAEELISLVREDGALMLEPMYEMSVPRRNALLRRWLALHHAPMPSRSAILRIWDEVVLSRDDASPRQQFGDYDVRRYQNALWWVERRSGLRDVCLEWPSDVHELRLPERLGCLSWADAGIKVRAPQAGELVSIRFGAPGLVYIAGRPRGRTLKKLWQELNVAPWRRDTTPLLFYGDTLIAALGVFITRDGLAEDKPGIHINWQKGKEGC